MRLLVICMSALTVLGLPLAAAAQTAPVDSLSAFLQGGASTWDVATEPDMPAIARREALARDRDDASINQVAGNGAEGGKRFDREAEAAEDPLRVSASIAPAPVRQRTRAVTPARSAEAAPGRKPRAFLSPWQTGVFQ